MSLDSFKMSAGVVVTSSGPEKMSVRWREGEGGIDHFFTGWVTPSKKVCVGVCVDGGGVHMCVCVGCGVVMVGCVCVCVCVCVYFLKFTCKF